MKVEVTQLDIDEGIRKNLVYCMVSTAIGRLMPDATRIETVAGTIRYSVNKEGRRYIYSTPDNVRRYLLAFDAGDQIEPFSFELKEPQIVRTVRSANAKRIITRSARHAPTFTRSARVYGERAVRANELRPRPS